jgi:predicted transcriptional regulator
MQYMARETLTVRVDAQTREALDAVAASLDRDRSYVVNEAIAAYLDVHQWHVQHIRQGLAEADAGQFVSSPELNSVLDRLRNR